MFILLGRDANAPSLVDAWAAIREREGEDAAKVEEARTCATSMRTYLADKGKTERAVLLLDLPKLKNTLAQITELLNTDEPNTARALELVGYMQDWCGSTEEPAS